MTDKYLLIVAIILMLYVIIGIYPFSSFNKENFLISSRKLSGFSNGFSIAASKIGGGLLVTYSTIFFTFGWSAIFYFVGIIFGYVLFYFFAYKLVDEAKNNNYYTVADYFNAKFNNKVALIVGFLTTLSVFGWILTNLVAGSILISHLTNLSPFFTTVILSLVIGSYLYVGGFDSVVKTDVIQYLSLLVIFIIFTLFLMLGNFHSHPVTVNSIPIGQVIGFIILGILFPMGSGELWQRIYAAKNKTELKKSLIIASISYILLGVSLSIICFKILSISTSLPAKNEIKLFIGIDNIVKNIQPILPYVWLIAYISAIISSADTFVFTTASSIVQDLLQKSNKVSENNIVIYIKNTIILLLIVSIVIALLLPNVVNLTFLFVGFTLNISGLAYFSRLRILNGKNKAFIISSISGIFAVLIHFVVSNFNANIITAIIGLIVTSLILLLYILWLRLPWKIKKHQLT